MAHMKRCCRLSVSLAHAGMSCIDPFGVGMIETGGIKKSGGMICHPGYIAGGGRYGDWT